MALTAKRIRDLKPGNKVTYHWDTQCIGLGIRVMPTGAMSWVLNYRYAGKKQRMTLGRVSDHSLIDARALHKTNMDLIAADVDPVAAKKAKRDQPTIGDMFDQFTTDYLDSPKSALRAPTIELYRIVIEKHLRPKLGGIKKRAVTRGDIKKMHRSIGSESPFMANRALAVASRIFNEAVDNETMERNPCKGVEKFPEPKRERYASPEEMIRLTTTLAETDNQDVANVIRLLMVTGCRKGEAQSARWEQFEAKPGFWVKQAHETKQKKLHRIPLNEHARELIQMLRDDRASISPYIFPTRNRFGHIVVSHKQWKAIRDAADLTNFQIHDLRHSFASVLVSSGFGLQQIGKLLGHTNASTTMRYAHVTDQAQQVATDAVADVLPSNVLPFREA